MLFIMCNGFPREGYFRGTRAIASQHLRRPTWNWKYVLWVLIAVNTNSLTKTIALVYQIVELTIKCTIKLTILVGSNFENLRYVPSPWSREPSNTDVIGGVFTEIPETNVQCWLVNGLYHWRQTRLVRSLIKHLVTQEDSMKKGFWYWLPCNDKCCRARIIDDYVWRWNTGN